MSDHSVLLPPAVKHRLRWSPHRQKWKLIVKLTCHRQLPPPALPPPGPPVVGASPNSHERKEITSWLQKIHRQIGLRDNLTLVRLLKQRGTHPWVLKMAREHRCSACEESKPLALRHITSSMKTFLVQFWCQFMVGVGSRVPMDTVFDVAEGLVCSSWKTSSCSNGSRWLIHEQRDARHVASRSWNQHRGHSWRGTVETVHHRRHHETGEADSTHLRAGSGTRRFLQAVTAYSRLLKHGGYTPLQLLFGHEPGPIERETRLTMNKVAVSRGQWPRDWQGSSQP